MLFIQKLLQIALLVSAVCRWNGNGELKDKYFPSHLQCYDLALEHPGGNGSGVEDDTDFWQTHQSDVTL